MNDNQGYLCKYHLFESSYSISLPVVVIYVTFFLVALTLTRVLLACNSTLMAFTFKFFTEVLFLSIILCLANTGIVNVLVSTLYSKPDEVTGVKLR